VAIYRDGSKGTQPLNVTEDAKREPSQLDAAGNRVLESLAAGKAPAVGDVKTLEAKVSEKIELTAKQVIAASATFQRALAEIAKAAAVPVIKATPALPRTEAPTEQKQDPNGPPRAIRHRLPEERASVTHKFSIAGHEGYITVGLYPTGQPGEIFIKMAKEGSTVSGLMDAFATSVSLALQHGVPLKVLCEKFAHTRFEPSGWTGNEQIGYAKSLMDYIFRWLNLRFLSGTQLTLFAGFAPQVPQLPSTPSLLAEDDSELDEPYSQNHLAKLAEEVAKRLNSVSSHPNVSTGGSASAGGGIAPEAQSWSSSVASPAETPAIQDRGVYHHAADAMRDLYDMGDAPSCSTCGAIMVRNGSCYRCMSCGSTSGCS